ncbi:MAG: hypothetical protein ACE5GX_14035 [Thermoanaerobaculia bacterium]
MNSGHERQESDERHRSHSNSYLVRVWQETGSEARVRFYLRDLKTGEERYLGDPERVGEILSGGLERRSGAARSQETA